MLYDDWDIRAGEKFADSDLIGIPHRIIVSDKTVGAGEGMVEYKNRKTGETKIIAAAEVEKLLKK